MITIQVPPLQLTLASATGRLDPEVERNIDIRAHATISSLLGDKNELWLGKPEVFDLVTVSQISGAMLPPTLALIGQSADVLIVQFACSFRPAPECEFVRSSVRVWMESNNAQGEQPRALDVFPRLVELPITFKRTLSVSPELKMSFEKVAQIEASAFKIEGSQEYLKYEPEITSFGVGENNPGWDLNKTRSRPIRGVKDLFVLLRKPKGASLEVRFEVSAWVQTNIGRFPLPSFFLSGSDKPLATERFVLS